MLIMGNVMFCCILWLSGKYVLKIENAEKGFIYITTWSVLGVNKISKHPVTILKAMKYHQGYTKIPDTPATNAPWFQIKTIKGKILVIDAQGNFVPKWANKL